MRGRRRLRRGLWSGLSPSPVLASVACLLGCLGATKLAQDEGLAAGIAAAAGERSASARDTALEAYGDRSPAHLPQRAIAPLAQLAINGAHLGASPALRALNAVRAKALIDHLERTRPGRDTTVLLVTQRELLVNHGATAAALGAFAGSYRVRPFYAAFAAWRIAFARIYWSALDPATQRAVIEEAVWQTRYDNGRRGGIERLLGDSPAAAAYQLRMVAIGHGAG